MSHFIRIGDKLIDPGRIHERIQDILSFRSQGCSQQDVADRLGVDRSLVSRLEAMGEVRRGGSLALVAFPVANGDAVRLVAVEEGVDLSIIMNNEERWAFVRERTGAQLVNDVIKIVGQLRSYDKVVLMGSDERIRFAKALLDKEVISMELGKSPLLEDVSVDPGRLRAMIQELKGGEARDPGKAIPQDGGGESS